MAKITYTNKVALNENPEIALINKVTDDDLNEIKSVVNTNDDNVGDLTNLTTTTKTNIVAAVNELNSDKAEDDIILVQSTEPSSETNILWINDGQIGTPASEITNSYSTSTGIGYSANYVNNNIEPKGVVIYDGLTKYANDIMTIPQEYKKLDVYCYSYVNAPAKNIISIDTSTNSTQFTTGAVFALPDAYFVEIGLIFKTNRTLRADYCATYPNFASSSATTRNNDNNFYVYKIVGYK